MTMGDDQCVTDSVKEQLKEKYLAARKLLDEESKNDPETEPYKSKYAAMEILKSMQDLLMNTVDNAKQHESEVTSMLAVVYMNMGIIAIETEELKSGQENLENCIDILSKTDVTPETIIPVISALNQLGILWSKRDQPKKAKAYLEKAEKIYKDFKDTGLEPIRMASLFGVEDPIEITALEILEKLYTLTLYYLAQIYGSLENVLKSAVYCHMTLRRQLEMNDFDSVDWALNAATLSQFFMEKGGFQQARHHLSAATYILGKYEENLKEISTKEPKDEVEREVLDAKWEVFKHRSADISRCWAKYGILLMCISRDRLMANTENGDEMESIPDNTNIRTDPKSDITQDCLDNMKFESLQKNIEYIESTITDKYLLDFNDAKLVFLSVQKWLDDAKTYYTLDGQASDYIQIIQDMSQLYKFLTFFEENDDRQAKMHKRRIDLLESIVRELNEKYYQNDCRQIWIELGETYSEILDIKLDKLKASDERPTPHMLSKINNLVKSSIDNFNKFLDSVKDTKNEKYSDELIRPALCSHFHIGRLYNKFITPDKKLQLEYIKKSYEAYEFLVNYCEKDEKAAKIMTEELNLCKEFVKLLPVKINRLTNEIANS